jgi:hypothetical protein
VETEIESMINNNGTPENAVAKMAESINKSMEDYNLINDWIYFERIVTDENKSLGSQRRFRLCTGKYAGSF